MNYNKLILAGHLTRDPELKYLPSNVSVVEFGLAVNYKSKNYEETLFIDCVAFGRTGENINKYMKKGSPLFIEGRLTLDQWRTDKNEIRKKYKVTVNNFQFMDSGKDTTSAANSTTSTVTDDDCPF